jgi:hypothetical protein
MDITTQEVARAEWRATLDGIAERCRGWAATVELIGSDIGDQVAAEGLAFQGISYETRGPEARNILVELGDSPGELFVHRVARPCGVRIAFTRPGAEADVQLETEEGVTTLVRLVARAALPPGRSAPRKAGAARARRTGVAPVALVLGALAGAAIVVGVVAISRRRARTAGPGLTPASCPPR